MKLILSSVPILHARLYRIIREKNRGKIVRTSILKSIMVRTILCDGEDGFGNRKGIPKRYFYDIVREMIEMKLIKRIDKTKYVILDRNKSCLKKLREFP